MYNSHTGEIALLVGNGINQKLTPPHWFNYPAFGMNTIFKNEGWIPDYYTAVDARVMNEFGSEINKKYKDIPKFIPRPNLDTWQGENFYRFLHRPGEIFPKEVFNNTESLLDDGITYSNIMHVAMQIAAWMGFTTLLMIGVSHKPDDPRIHFWGLDEGMSEKAPVEQWFGDYQKISKTFQKSGITVLNISEDTYCPESVLPRGNWRDWRNT